MNSLKKFLSVFLVQKRLVILLCVLLLLGATLRLYRLNYQSLWVDEVVTYLNSSGSFHQVLFLPMINSNIPPLYYLVVNTAIKLDRHEWMVRLPSLIFGLLSILLIYFVVRNWLGKNIGLISALLMAISPFHIWYSQEARPYSLLIFLSLLSIFLLQQLIKNETNLGFAKANNQAIKKSQGKYILLLNSDTEIRDSAIEKTVDYISKNKEVGILGCKLINPGNVVELSCRTFPEPEIVWYINNPFKRIYHNKSMFKKYFLSDWKHDQIREVDWVTGAYLLARRNILTEVGLLDESFFMYFEDVDLCCRVKKNGWKIIYYPFAEAFHVKSYTTHKAFPFSSKIMTLKGFLLFSEKRYSEEKALKIRNYIKITSRLQIINIYIWDFYKIWKRKENKNTFSSFLDMGERKVGIQ